MLNKKGFTLIELLAVIIILVSISLIVVSSITSSLTRRSEKECEEQKELAKNAAKIFFSLNECTVKEAGDTCDVDIRVLKEHNYFNENSKVDRLEDDSKVSMTVDGYIYNGECK